MLLKRPENGCTSITTISGVDYIPLSYVNSAPLLILQIILFILSMPVSSLGELKP